MSGEPANNSDWIDLSSMFPRVLTYDAMTALLGKSELHSEFAGLFQAVGAGRGRAEPALRRSLLSLNGEEHRRLRAAVARHFTPRATDSLRSFASEVATSMVAGLAAGEPVEFMSAFVQPYIGSTTSEYLGLPAGTLDQLRPAIDLISEAAGDIGQRAPEWDEGIVALLDYSYEALGQRPFAAGVIGELSRSTDRGEIDETFAATLITTALSAGIEPTVFQLGLLIETLAEEPDVWRQLSRGEQSHVAVLEESLRYRSTNPGVARLATSAVEHRGHTFPAGSRVMMEISAANHDAERFECPGQFDIEANDGPHMAFGFGPHFCLGAALARLQLLEALKALTAALGQPRVEEVVEKVGGGVKGPVSLTVSFAAFDAG